MADIHIHTLHDPEGKHPDLPDYWLAWANGVQGDGRPKTARSPTRKNASRPAKKQTGPFNQTDPEDEHGDDAQQR